MPAWWRSPPTCNGAAPACTIGSSTRVIAAGTIITIAPALIVFFFAQRFFMRGMEGAIK